MEEICAGTQTGESGKKSILRGEMQLAVAAKYEAEGVVGLKKMLISIAERHDDGKTQSWKKFLDFARQKEDWVMFYLCSMDPEFLRALVSLLLITSTPLTFQLAGTVLKEWEEDAGFEHIMRTKHALRNTPQVYGNGLGRVRTSRINDTQDARELARLECQGTGGSPEQILAALKLGREYLRVENGSTVQLAKEIDEMMPQRHYAKSPWKRKYVPTVASLENLRVWFRGSIRSLEAAMKGKSEAEKKTDVEWTFLEAGFGVSGSGRGPNHVWHDGTNYLFGLVTACMMQPRPHDFGIKTFVIFHVMKPEHADPCEVLGSLCGGTYGKKGWEGFGMHGLNPALAGGAVLNAPHKEKESDRAINLQRYDEMWAYNCRKAVAGFDTTYEKARKMDAMKVQLWKREIRAAASSMRFEDRIAAHPAQLNDAKRAQRARREAGEAKPGPGSHSVLLAKLREKMGVEVPVMRPPKRPLRILPSSSPPEARDEQEAKGEGVLPSVEMSFEGENEQRLARHSSVLIGSSPPRQSSVVRESIGREEVVPESSWVTSAQRVRADSDESHITVEPYVPRLVRRVEREDRAGSSVSAAFLRRRAALRRPALVQAAAASQGSRGISVFDIPDEDGTE